MSTTNGDHTGRRRWPRPNSYSWLVLAVALLLIFGALWMAPTLTGILDMLGTTAPQPEAPPPR